MFVVLLNVSPLIAAEGYFFCLETKEAKIQVSKKASLPHKALRCKPVRTTGRESFARLHSRRFCKSSQCPCHAQSHHRSSRFRTKLIC
jgi:hypothetical protein